MEGKQCKKCRAIKPLAEFKRKLSKTQSIAKGYTGAVALEVESSMCKACQPKKKPPSKMSAKELHNKVVSGDIRPYVAEQVLERRAELRPIRQGMAIRRQWEKKWAGDLRAFLRPMQLEIQSVDRQIRYSCTDQPERLKFFTWYLETLRVEKNKIEFDYAKTPRKPPEIVMPKVKYKKGEEVVDVRWQGLISGTVIAEAQAKWGEIPIEKRVRMKQPALVVYRYGIPDTSNNN